MWVVSIIDINTISILSYNLLTAHILQLALKLLKLPIYVHVLFFHEVITVLLYMCSIVIIIVGVISTITITISSNSSTSSSQLLILVVNARIILYSYMYICICTLVMSHCWVERTLLECSCCLVELDGTEVRDSIHTTRRPRPRCLPYSLLSV